MYNYYCNCDNDCNNYCKTSCETNHSVLRCILHTTILAYCILHIHFIIWSYILHMPFISRRYFQYVIWDWEWPLITTIHITYCIYLLYYICLLFSFVRSFITLPTARFNMQQRRHCFFYTTFFFLVYIIYIYLAIHITYYIYL